jgi:hypothetical protein
MQIVLREKQWRQIAFVLIGLIILHIFLRYVQLTLHDINRALPFLIAAGLAYVVMPAKYERYRFIISGILLLPVVLILCDRIQQRRRHEEAFRGTFPMRKQPHEFGWPYRGPVTPAGKLLVNPEQNTYAIVG